MTQLIIKRATTNNNKKSKLNDGASHHDDVNDDTLLTTTIMAGIAATANITASQTAAITDKNTILLTAAIAVTTQAKGTSAD